MREIRFTIRDPRGLHVVPLGSLVHACCAFDSNVLFICKDGTLNGKDLPSMLRVVLRRYDSFALRFSGRDEEKAANYLTDLINKSLA